MSQKQIALSRNPATEEVIQEYSLIDNALASQKIDQAAVAYQSWRTQSVQDRAEVFRNVASELRNSLEESAQLITEEMGKSIKEARAEVEKCALGCEFYAEHGPQFLENEQVATDAGQSYVRSDPLGVVLAVMPWNFPFWQVLRFAAPTLIAGNAGLLKHASNVSGCALRIEEILLKAGVPEGLFQTLLISSSQVADVISHDQVRAVSLTGSEVAGKAVAEVAGRNLKKLVLELGGSDAFIVLEDADLDLVTPNALKSRMLNCGQSCIAAKRFIVVETLYDEFVERLQAEIEGLQAGDPTDESIDLGPLARKDLVDDLDRQVQASVSEGAQLRSGGKRLDRRGYFYAPTLLAGVTQNMTCFKEETFGPVAAVAAVTDADAAIALANSSRFGLGGSLWSADLERAQKLAARIDSGGVFINEFTKSDPRVPFGGVKDSGYGRELSVYGIREFVNTKTVWIR